MLRQFASVHRQQTESFGQNDLTQPWRSLRCSAFIIAARHVDDASYPLQSAVAEVLSERQVHFSEEWGTCEGRRGRLRNEHADREQPGDQPTVGTTT